MISIKIEKTRQGHIKFQREKPNDLWQVDIVLRSYLT